MQKYFYICDHSGHVNMYNSHKRHKGTPLISLNRQCILPSEIMQEMKPCFCLFWLLLEIPKPSTTGTFYIFPRYVFFLVLSKISHSLVAFWVELLAPSEPCSSHFTLLLLLKPDSLPLQSL